MRIAFVGALGSGKSEAAKMLKQDQGYEIISFADPVRDVTAEMLNVFSSFVARPFEVLPSITGPDLHQMKSDPAIRKMLQFVGTELGREWTRNNNTWVDIFARRVGDLQNVANDDCRFPNEAERARELGFLIVRIERNHNERLEYIRKRIISANPNATYDEIEDAIEDMMLHPSETESAKIEADIIIPNHNLNQLRKMVNYVASNEATIRDAVHSDWTDEEGV